jgi:hypothetical protein
MSAYGCAEVRDLAPELALGVLSGYERAEAVLHVNGCARCQVLVGQLTDASDALALLTPEIEPPVGFSRRVMAALDAPARRVRRRWIAAMAGAAAAAAILSVTIVRVVESGEAAMTAAAKPVAAQMVGTANNVSAGWVYVTGGRSLAITLDYSVPPGTYRIDVRPAQGHSEVVGHVVVAGGRGSWTGRSDELVAAGSTIALVDVTGAEVCHAVVT